MFDYRRVTEVSSAMDIGSDFYKLFSWSTGGASDGIRHELSTTWGDP